MLLVFCGFMGGIHTLPFGDRSKHPIIMMTPPVWSISEFVVHRMFNLTVFALWASIDNASFAFSLRTFDDDIRVAKRVVVGVGTYVVENVRSKRGIIKTSTLPFSIWT